MCCSPHSNIVRKNKSELLFAAWIVCLSPVATVESAEALRIGKIILRQYFEDSTAYKIQNGRHRDKQ